MSAKAMASLAAGLGLLLAAWTTAAEAPKPPKSPPGARARVYGTVQVDKDKAGKLAAVRVVSVNQVTYRVTLDENGVKLGTDMAGRRASVLGYVSGAGTTRSLTVVSYGEISRKKKEEPKRPKPAPRRSTPKKTK